MSCSEKGCPFPVDGDILCRYHRQTFSWEMSMEDRAVDVRTFDMETKQTVDGLSVFRPKSGGGRAKDWMFHKAVASSGMLRGSLTLLSQASEKERTAWSTNHWAAVEFFELSRYEGKIVCQICGWQEVHEFWVGLRHVYKCKLCRYQFSVMRNTFLMRSHLPLDRWVRATLLMTQENNHGAITLLQEQVGLPYKTAWDVNYTLRSAGMLIGESIGFDGNSKNAAWQLSKERILAELRARELTSATADGG